MLAAKFAMLFQLQFFLNDFLVFSGIIINALAFGAFQANKFFFILCSHIIIKAQKTQKAQKTLLILVLHNVFPVIF